MKLKFGRQYTEEMLEEIGVKKYSAPVGLFTHWYEDERTGEPVPVALMMNDEARFLRVPKLIVDNVHRAALCGRFMVVTSFIRTGRVHVERVSESFPRLDHQKVVNQLAEMLDARIKVSGSLPKAKFDVDEELADRIRSSGLNVRKGASNNEGD